MTLSKEAKNEADDAVRTANEIEGLSDVESHRLTSKWVISRRLSRAVHELNVLLLDGRHKALARRALAKLGFSA